MGKNDSSKYRVLPLMRKINEVNRDFSRELAISLNCLELDGKSKKSFTSDSLTGKIEVCYTDKDNNTKEKGLRQSKDYMIKLVETLRDDYKKREYSRRYNRSSTRNDFYSSDIDDRCKIANGYIERIKSFYSNNKSDNIGRQTWSFEGDTYPDIFIETEKYIIVAEGKWTEGKRTSSTTHLKNRDQLIRHIQGAIEYRRNHQIENKLIIGFYIVNRKDILDRNFPITEKDFEDIIDKEDIQMSNKDLLLESYYGCTDWETIGDKFNLVFEDVAKDEY